MKRPELPKLKQYYTNDGEDNLYAGMKEQSVQPLGRLYGNASIDDYYSVFNDAAEEPVIKKRRFKDIMAENLFLRLQYMSIVLMFVVLGAGVLMQRAPKQEEVPDYGEEQLSLSEPKEENSSVLSEIVYDVNFDSEIIETYGMKFLGLALEKMVCGSEILSVAMVLDRYGLQLTPEKIFSGYTDRTVYPNIYNGVRLGRSPVQYFIGNPFEKGYGIFAEGVRKIIARIRQEYKLNIEAINISGATEAEFIDYLDNGYKIITWFTKELAPVDWHSEYWHFSDGTLYRWPAGTVCGVAVDYTGTHITVYDPSDSIKKYERTAFIESWQSVGPYPNETSQAVAVKCR